MDETKRKLDKAYAKLMKAEEAYEDYTTSPMKYIPPVGYPGTPLEYLTLLTTNQGDCSETVNSLSALYNTQLQMSQGIKTIHLFHLLNSIFFFLFILVKIDWKFNYNYFQTNIVDIKKGKLALPPNPDKLLWSFFEPQVYGQITQLMSGSTGMICVLTGRRRVGKSVCVQRVCSVLAQTKGLKFFCITGSITESDFVDSVCEEIDRLGIQTNPPRNKLSAINFLIWLYVNEYRVVIDEYQYLDAISGLFLLLKVEF